MQGCNDKCKIEILEKHLQKKKKKKEKMKSRKVANRKLGKVRNLGNLGKTIPSFLISGFSILPYSQTWKLGFKNLGIKFPRFLTFQRGSSLIVYEAWWVNHGAFYISLT